MAEEKTAIARLAASMVADHQLVIINGGTTCYALASALAGRRMSVVTNALPVASLLSIDFQTEVTLIGGYLYPRTGVALGLNSRDQMSSIRADLLITGCGGISEDGIYNINQMMADMDSTMMKSADRVILLADSSKFGRGGLARVCDLNNVNTIITDRGLDKNWKKRFESSSTEVIIAD